MACYRVEVYRSVISTTVVEVEAESAEQARERATLAAKAANSWQTRKGWPSYSAEILAPVPPIPFR